MAKFILKRRYRGIKTELQERHGKYRKIDHVLAEKIRGKKNQYPNITTKLLNETLVGEGIISIGKISLAINGITISNNRHIYS
ncbi:hypothetical protein Q2T46_06945 [Thermoanaerobacterium sp. CMT5567-10]|uniref:hypothetical protein n=1 Tax=Thermoanaerobacterium sp. CMT5567-10 TaxID=3061989 RepID=UPI0026DFEFBB|nr:hypothetical protein [Thermoanaerobacterium sp. CMT5567-10]WKV10163.1 hypothetical protein Q2T46_06945 [Thermoanaerobacterium sp. CMT5567-10]